ncbi:MAG TPA: hypothetical protein VI423_10860 [Paenisporosarcina sp.]|nr:hypothetical protein [Paenisporosarcina sp.]
MTNKVDFQVINATYDAISPIIKANGQTKEDVGRFVYYLLVISAAIADQLGITAEHFRALAVSAFETGKNPVINKTNPSN